WLAGRMLGGKGTFTSTMRGFGFAHSAYAILLLGLIPSLRPLASLLAVLLSVFGVWIGAAEAHKTRGWRTALFPVVAVAIAVLGLALLQQLVAGAALTLESIAQALGIAP
ncbi:MAG: YIP1 family protein, partial [Anaerolineae bacterium]|nr:YIP1 family protein [Anaerolineae bacterium]